MDNYEDLEKYRMIKEFNDFDLYSKEDKEFKLTDEIKKYYADLMLEYFISELQW